MMIGDLVCYNACGMKKNTIGLVLELQQRLGTKSILIQWCAVGDYMPRKTYGPFGTQYPENWHKKIVPGDIVWHEFGDWFHVIK